MFETILEFLNIRWVQIVFVKVAKAKFHLITVILVAQSNHLLSYPLLILIVNYSQQSFIHQWNFSPSSTQSKKKSKWDCKRNWKGTCQFFYIFLILSCPFENSCKGLPLWRSSTLKTFLYRGSAALLKMNSFLGIS